MLLGRDIWAAMCRFSCYSARRLRKVCIYIYIYILNLFICIVSIDENEVVARSGAPPSSLSHVFKEDPDLFHPLYIVRPAPLPVFIPIFLYINLIYIYIYISFLWVLPFYYVILYFYRGFINTMVIYNIRIRVQRRLNAVLMRRVNYGAWLPRYIYIHVLPVLTAIYNIII